jgi:hypothetical protein
MGDMMQAPIRWFLRSKCMDEELAAAKAELQRRFAELENATSDISNAGDNPGPQLGGGMDWYYIKPSEETLRQAIARYTSMAGRTVRKC